MSILKDEHIMQKRALCLLIFSTPLFSSAPVPSPALSSTSPTSSPTFISGKTTEKFTFNRQTQTMPKHILQAADDDDDEEEAYSSKTDFAYTQVFLSSQPAQMTECTLHDACQKTGYTPLVHNDIATLGRYMQGLKYGEEELSETNFNTATLQHDPNPNLTVMLNRHRTVYAPIVACRLALKEGRFRYYPNARPEQSVRRNTITRRDWDDPKRNQEAELVIFPNKEWREQESAPMSASASSQSPAVSSTNAHLQTAAASKY